MSLIKAMRTKLEMRSFCQLNFPLGIQEDQPLQACWRLMEVCPNSLHMLRGLGKRPRTGFPWGSCGQYYGSMGYRVRCYKPSSPCLTKVAYSQCKVGGCWTPSRLPLVSHPLCDIFGQDLKGAADVKSVSSLGTSEVCLCVS